LEVAFPPYRLDLTNERLWRADQEIRLRPKTFAVLRYLVDRPGRLRSVWPDVTVSDSMPRLCIREIRAALRDDARRPRYLETRVGRGYRFVAPVHPTLDPGTAAHPPTPGTPIVGRDAEWARLKATLARVREGRRAIVFVTGEPGIGKTTLVEAFLASGPAAARVGLGQCVEPYGRGDPYLPLIEALERLGRSEGGRSVAEAMQRWAPTWLRQASALLDPDEREVRARRRGSTTPRGMLRELAAFLEALTQERELIMWLEDLHWADASTLEAIAFLARRREPARLFLVATYRPAELGTADHPLLRLTRELVPHRFAEELALGPLTETAVGEYLAGRLGASVSPELTRYVHTRTEGNPLFIVTVVDDLLNRAAIEQANGAWTLRRIASEPGEVPDTLRQLLELQTERLSAADRRLLEVSSVAGVEFSTAAVAASLGQPILSVEARLASLARLGRFIRARGPGRWPDGTLAHRFAFIHALYQQVLYTAIPAARASEWPGQIGACLEAAYGARAFEIASELAMHCERARDPSGALRYFRLAGETALDRTAHGEAIAHLSHALALVEELPEGLPRTRAGLEVLVTLGSAWIVANGYAAPEVERTYERALAACRRLGAPRGARPGPAGTVERPACSWASGRRPRARPGAPGACPAAPGRCAARPRPRGPRRDVLPSSPPARGAPASRPRPRAHAPPHPEHAAAAGPAGGGVRELGIVDGRLSRSGPHARARGSRRGRRPGPPAQPRVRPWLHRLSRAVLRGGRARGRASGRAAGPLPRVRDPVLAQLGSDAGRMGTRPTGEDDGRARPDARGAARVPGHRR
jgi:DNA-binding winged helix-turn-helix (wHTH) protein